MAIIKIKEILGTSTNSFDDALQNAVSYACEEKQNVTGADILRQTITIKEGKIAEYKVNIKVAYLWEK